MRKIIAVLTALMLVLSLAACGGNGGGQEAAIPGLEDGVLTVAMECAYAPYNWAQEDDSNGAVPIKDSPLFANGYDVQMAKAICEFNGWELEIVQTDWDSLIPGVVSGLYDATIAGQSMTSERMETVDFAGPYLYATIVCLARNDSRFASAHGLADLAGGSCTSQSGTIWYETCLPQIANANILSPTESAPAMLMAAASNPDIFVCTDRPTAQGALIAYPELVLLDFANSGDDFEVSDEEVNIGIAVQKGNTALRDAIDAYLSTLTADDFNARMDQAISIQPLGE
ncbi:MAG: transporter substrate-binding domain-containing protein [Firmicutes bacterium]|nr:transporter substrate-binding domain-containing protein [Bacillota bacterium]MBR0482043.1 transporter substrate-binding domain-containing protein [Bacillota bacterium]